MVGAFLTDRGMEFQMKTDDQEKARWPIVRLVRGIVKRDWSLDRSWREGLYGEINSFLFNFDPLTAYVVLCVRAESAKSKDVPDDVKEKKQSDYEMHTAIPRFQEDNVSIYDEIDERPAPPSRPIQPGTVI